MIFNTPLKRPIKGKGGIKRKSRRSKRIDIVKWQLENLKGYDKGVREDSKSADENTPPATENENKNEKVRGTFQLYLDLVTRKEDSQVKGKKVRKLTKKAERIAKELMLSKVKRERSKASKSKTRLRIRSNF
mmetsp:Transcript_31777/g.44311  ORF Transcript_31777/g.44311 Transcript_31777/m.44311 type:complete len:132 (-) Transcript_31777:286-681(-)|eukprot:CAMPEP_0185254612 /NCGR_PEP_ID=MMETSP1359-20130426/3498_1 /TAXON_ID=552665 /ORGANISM="Bigelowiella longifila, Strain CCMP242" /LENGTH=131 /DNA_ID=CAMNT_0027837837 /DNA_START=47 /DNA_END=442 /DNA_ORIENTATION=-